jgi:hypothetical protein
MKQEHRKLTKAEIKKFKYGLIAAEQTAEDEANGEMSILHFCGYVKPPTKEDVVALKEELNTDPEFGLVGRIGKDVFILDASKDVVEFYTNMVDK